MQTSILDCVLDRTALSDFVCEIHPKEGVHLSRAVEQSRSDPSHRVVLSSLGIEHHLRGVWLIVSWTELHLVTLSARYIPGKGNILAEQLSSPDQILPTE